MILSRGVAAAAFAVLIGHVPIGPVQTGAAEPPVTVQVTRVIDGDTVELADGRHVRLMGIDAPEMDQEMGRQSRAWLATLIDGRPVELQRSRSGAWGRVDAVIVWRGMDIGEAMLWLGWAWFDVRYTPAELRVRYAEQEDFARTRRVGLWMRPEPVAPWDFRRKRTIKLPVEPAG